MESRDPRPGCARKLQEDARRYAEHRADATRRLEELVASLEAERARLEGEVDALRTALHGREEEELRLSERLAAIVDENRRLAEEYMQVERQSSSLASLYAASFQLHESLGREQVLTAIQEIVISLIGCEELVVLEADREAPQLKRVCSFGIEPDELSTVPLDAGPIGHAVQTGEVFVRKGPAPNETVSTAERELTACVPLKVDGSVTGAIVLFRLLPHKAGLEEADLELFELLSTQAASALHCAELHERLTGG